MRCKKCGYDLRGQEENRCPECDTEFHPDDPTTFLTASVSGRRYIMRVVIGIILFVIPLLVANDDLIKAIPPSMRFIFFVSPIMMVGGLTLGGVADYTSYRAISGRIPWISHRTSFWFALITGGIFYLGVMITWYFMIIE